MAHMWLFQNLVPFRGSLHEIMIGYIFGARCFLWKAIYLCVVCIYPKPLFRFWRPRRTGILGTPRKTFGLGFRVWELLRITCTDCSVGTPIIFLNAPCMLKAPELRAPIAKKPPYGMVWNLMVWGVVFREAFQHGVCECRKTVYLGCAFNTC